ncbi:MAG: SDR family NAD(P)-dependent oxidoreductase [Puniceicoccales bacterium]
MADLAQKHLLICGASSGLGLACAQAAAAAGAVLVLNGRDQARLEQTLSGLPGEGHTVFAGDLTEAEVRRSLADIVPTLAGVVFAAGLHRIKPAKFLDDAGWGETFAVNHRAPCLLTTALLKAKKLSVGASLVYLGSIAADVATVGNALYAGSKGALVSSVRVLALELARQRIRANVVSPGQVKTAMTEANAAQLSADVLARNESLYPLGQGTPEQVAATVLFLLGEGASWITGQNIVVDGGYTLT